MAGLIPDGVYKIRNVQFAGMVADLSSGTPEGPIFGVYGLPSNRFDKWIITNVAGGSNQITIGNWTVQGTFANAQQFPGARLVGSSTPTIWTVVQGDRGYYLQSPNALIWGLPNSGPRVPIVLSTSSGQGNTQWIFDQML